MKEYLLGSPRQAHSTEKRRLYWLWSSYNAVIHKKQTTPFLLWFCLLILYLSWSKSSSSKMRVKCICVIKIHNCKPSRAECSEKQKIHIILYILFQCRFHFNTRTEDKKRYKRVCRAVEKRMETERRNFNKFIILHSFFFSFSVGTIFFLLFRFYFGNDITHRILKASENNRTESKENVLSSAGSVEETKARSKGK